jgi:hypothetical protein
VTRRRRNWPATLGIFKCLALTLPTVVLTACGGATQTGAQGPPSPAHPASVVDSHGIAWPVIDRDGTYLVDVDIWPGRYRSIGGSMCHWARLRSHDPNDVIESKTADDPQTITIQATDRALITQNCGSWQMIPF